MSLGHPELREGKSLRFASLSVTFRLAVAVLLAAAFAPVPAAGAQQPIGAVALGDLVQGLGVNTRVLVIGAHPDDEDTYLISWLARGKHVETAYLSLTRGEGGQNLIGNELGYALGQIRTEELLAARRIDGGHQYFTRAVDFGFSKSLAETSERWPRELILRDVVAIIRSFRPHVIVSVWTGTEADGHGHHQYAGVIAKEAFEAAADSTRFRDVGGMPPAWAPLKLYRVARVRGGFSVSSDASDSPGNLKFNVGEYNPLFGRSYAELAAMSRSQHRSQGMGMILPVGVLWDGLTLDTSRVGLTRATDTALFAGIDTTWERFANLPPRLRPYLDSMLVAIGNAQRAFSAASPQGMVPLLAQVYNLAGRAGPQCHNFGEGCYLSPDFEDAIATTRDRASRALLQAAGVSVEAYAAREKVAAGDTVDLTVALYNRGASQVHVVFGEVWADTARAVFTDSLSLLPDSTLRLAGRLDVPAVTYPWWMKYGTDRDHAVYDLQDGPGWKRGRLPAEMLAGEDRLRFAGADVALQVNGAFFKVSSPIVYRFADPARGERRHPLVGVPRITSVFQSTVEYVRANRPVDRGIRVEVTSALSTPDTVNVQLGLPRGLRADSIYRRLILAPFGKASVFFRIEGRVPQEAYKVVARVTDRRGFYQQGIIDLEYEHIPPVRYYQPPEMYLSAVNVTIPPGLKVAYVRGVGDNVQPMLEQLGVSVKTLSPDALPMLDTAAYTTLVIGPRAYEAIPAVSANAAAIQNFARRGGTVVVQYAQNPAKPGVLPFPVALASPADRVTDETAPVTILDPTHRLLTTPNRITAADFEEWGQERALYMPRSFDAAWKSLLEMHDAGEPANRGALLVAPVGKGTFIYTTLSFFRQLPGGNPGAARLFVNLLSAGLRTTPIP